ncbi:hypothetical protein ACJJTC_015872 [Scirpophaga incertulas]
MEILPVPTINELPKCPVCRTNNTRLYPVNEYVDILFCNNRSCQYPFDGTEQIKFVHEARWDARNEFFFGNRYAHTLVQTGFLDCCISKDASTLIEGVTDSTSSEGNTASNSSKTLVEIDSNLRCSITKDISTPIENTLSLSEATIISTLTNTLVKPGFLDYCVTNDATTSTEDVTASISTTGASSSIKNNSPSIKDNTTLTTIDILAANNLLNDDDDCCCITKDASLATKDNTILTTIDTLAANHLLDDDNASVVTKDTCASNFTILKESAFVDNGKCCTITNVSTSTIVATASTSALVASAPTLIKDVIASNDIEDATSLTSSVDAIASVSHIRPAPLTNEWCHPIRNLRVNNSFQICPECSSEMRYFQISFNKICLSCENLACPIVNNFTKIDDRYPSDEDLECNFSSLGTSLTTENSSSTPFDEHLPLHRLQRRKCYVNKKKINNSTCHISEDVPNDNIIQKKNEVKYFNKTLNNVEIREPLINKTLNNIRTKEETDDGVASENETLNDIIEVVTENKLFNNMKTPLAFNDKTLYNIDTREASHAKILNVEIEEVSTDEIFIDYDAKVVTDTKTTSDSTEVVTENEACYIDAQVTSNNKTVSNVHTEEKTDIKIFNDCNKGVVYENETVHDNTALFLKNKTLNNVRIEKVTDVVLGDVDTEIEYKKETFNNKTEVVTENRSLDKVDTQVMSNDDTLNDIQTVEVSDIEILNDVGTDVGSGKQTVNYLNKIVHENRTLSNDQIEELANVVVLSEVDTDMAYKKETVNNNTEVVAENRSLNNVDTQEVSNYETLHKNVTAEWTEAEILNDVGTDVVYEKQTANDNIKVVLKNRISNNFQIEEETDVVLSEVHSEMEYKKETLSNNAEIVTENTAFDDVDTQAVSNDETLNNIQTEQPTDFEISNDVATCMVDETQVVTENRSLGNVYTQEVSNDVTLNNIQNEQPTDVEIFNDVATCIVDETQKSNDNIKILLKNRTSNNDQIEEETDVVLSKVDTEIEHKKETLCNNTKVEAKNGSLDNVDTQVVSNDKTWNNIQTKEPTDVEILNDISTKVVSENKIEIDNIELKIESRTFDNVDTGVVCNNKTQNNAQRGEGIDIKIFNELDAKAVSANETSTEVVIESGALQKAHTQVALSNIQKEKALDVQILRPDLEVMSESETSNNKNKTVSENSTLNNIITSNNKIMNTIQTDEITEVVTLSAVDVVPVKETLNNKIGVVTENTTLNVDNQVACDDETFNNIQLTSNETDTRVNKVDKEDSDVEELIDDINKRLPSMKSLCVKLNEDPELEPVIKNEKWLKTLRKMQNHSGLSLVRSEEECLVDNDPDQI